jgi:pimeloyl-ACP methyl ester carboxylesterase
MAVIAKEYATLTVNDWQVANFTQKIDHFTPADTRTYNQRYFMNDSFWDNKNGPVFLFICGEGRCKPPTTRGYPMQVCQDLKCLFYVVEHRYYGDSQPFPDWTTASLKYLNATQALADLDAFITAKNAEIIAKYGGANRKWVTIGGSYPGALSAWFKTSYPTQATAAWSSSGVILPVRNFVNFDLDIYTATSRSGPGCPRQIKNITDYIENAITDKLTPADKEFVHGVFDSAGVDNSDIMWYIADTFTLGVQYGGRIDLCDIFMSMEGADMKLQVPVVKQYADNHGVTLNQYDRIALSNTAMNYQDNMRQWTW